MKCPHCTVEFHDDWTFVDDLRDASGIYLFEWTVCPACRLGVLKQTQRTPEGVHVATRLLWPRAAARPVPSEVPEPYSGLYREACLVLGDSARASAALSRRALQQVLREVANAPASNLYDEIEWIVTNGHLPGHLQEVLHDLRIIGNMATHPTKSKATGEVVDVEPGEADWALDVLDALFDFFFVQPARTQARKAALQAKLGRDGTA